MARGKKSRASGPKPLGGVRGNGVLIEEMRAQNRATVEAVEASRVVLESKIDSLARETGGRLTVLEAAVRQNSRDIKQNSADIRKNSADIRKNSEDIRKNSGDIRKSGEDIRVLIERVDSLGPLDQRVSMLERRVLGES
jgi:methyl-accepting chemotaxis protein